MMKKWMLRALMCVALVGLFCLPAAASDVVASGYCGGEGDGTNLTWTLYETGELVIAGAGEMDDYTNYGYFDDGGPWCAHKNKIQTLIIGDEVTSIGNSAFSQCRKLVEISGAENVQEIGYNAFSFCESLISVTIGAMVDDVDISVFYGCTSLGEIVVEENNAAICSINGVLFSEDKRELLLWPYGKKGECEIPFGTVSIRERAFFGCVALSEAIIPDSVTAIGEGAFASSSITAVVIGNGVTEIPDDAFTTCEELTSVMIGSCVVSIGEESFAGCERLTSVIIPDSVVEIGRWAFSQCSRLNTVVIGAGLNSVDYSAFYGCTGIQTIYYTGNVAGWCGIDFLDAEANPLHCADSLYIGEDLIVDLVIPGGVFIGDYVFAGYKKLKSVYIPASANTTGYAAFSGCVGLTSVTLEEGLTVIDYQCFEGCTGLTKVDIPDSVIYIGGFGGCTGLTEVDIPDSVTTIGGYAFEGCTGLMRVEIPDGVTTIESGAFKGCTGLTRIDIPDSVTSIERYVFWNCTNLHTVVLPNGMADISEYAFYRCTGLASVLVPNSMITIQNQAFSYCNSMEMRFWGDAPKKIRFPSDVIIYYPEGNTTWTEDGRYDAIEGTFNSYTIKPWTPWKSYNFEPFSGDTLTTYGGAGTAYYRLFDKTGSALPGQDVTYATDGQQGTALTDGNGVFPVKISGATETRDYVIAFSGTEITEDVQGVQQTLTVINSAVPYSQSWSGSLGGSLKGSIGPSAGVGVGVATAEASAIKAAATGGVSGGYALTNSYADGVRTLDKLYL